MPIGKIQDIPGPGKVRDASARFSQSQWNEIKSLRGPAPDDWPGFGFWFNYFWDEAVTVPDLTNAEKQMLVETLSGVFQKQSGKWQLRTDPKSRENYHRLKMLRNLLHIGFVRVPDKQRGNRYVTTPATDAPGLFAEMVQMERENSAMTIGWRSDSRAYDMLVRQNGFQARARQDDVRSEWNLNQPWHPYSLDVYAKEIYLRRGQNRDNCLHTAVSVGTDFKALVHFPIFTDPSLYQPPRGPLTGAVGSTVKVNAKGQTARICEDKYGKFLEHDTQLYAVRITSSMSGYHTQEFQRVAGKDPFPERSVDQVPIANIVALVVVGRRYWWDNSSLSKTEHHWQIFDVDCREIQILNPTLLQMLYGESAAGRLDQHIRQQVGQAKARADFLADSKKRIREATTQRGPARATTKKDKFVCNDCGAGFPMKPLLTLHKCPARKGGGSP